MWQNIWSFEVQLVPILFAIVIFEIPSLIHRLNKQYYVPIYFSVFPFAKLNKDLSYYLVEDSLLLGSTTSEAEAESFRKRIVFISAYSVFLSSIVIPLVCGFICAFFLTKDHLFQFITVLVAYKIPSIVKAILNFKHHTVNRKGHIFFLSVVYFAYLGVVIQMILSAFNYATPYITQSDWTGLFSNVFTLIFNKVIAQGIIITLLSTIFISLFADRKVREENIKRDKDSQKKYETST